MFKAKALTVSCVMLGLLSGCNLLTPIAFLGPHQRKVPAEFDKLEGKRTLIMVWAEPETLFDYPHVRLELATYIGDKLAAGLKDCDLVDPRHVEDYLERTLDATFDPEKVGAQFDADAVLYVELLKFQIRDPYSPDLVRGQVNSTVTVYDLRADPDETRVYVLQPVDVLCPKNQPLLMSPRNALWVRQQTYEQLAENVARKFYEHMVEL